jgi:hypothetical protein
MHVDDVRMYSEKNCAECWRSADVEIVLCVCVPHRRSNTHPAHLEWEVCVYMRVGDMGEVLMHLCARHHGATPKNASTCTHEWEHIMTSSTAWSRTCNPQSMWKFLDNFSYSLLILTNKRAVGKHGLHSHLDICAVLSEQSIQFPVSESSPVFRTSTRLFRQL